ncbi:MAG: methylenetetrahydrofolate reductase C-terminal domain-containing protein, partial [Sedimentisphaerales bacterium]|nr:methylenetetrahydrofolate reductase C-terminal domain-containing protein [Sedimentisphaerales bacterium]
MFQERNYIRNLVNQADKFIILAEFVPLPGHKLDNFEKFLNDYINKKADLPEDIILGGITIPQSPSGVPSLSPADIYSVIDKKGLWQDLDVIPHITTKDHNTDGIRTYLFGLQKLGIESILALTGDKPGESQGVFEVDSIGLIKLIKEVNYQSFTRAIPGKFDQVHQFYIAAAVSQYKYTEASQMSQYYKMGKKIRAGADCLITQLGWDWRKCEELFRYLAEENLKIPVFGNVYVLTMMTPAPRLMHEEKLPGCVVTDKFFTTLQNETVAQQIERSAQQMAMYRDLGAVGIDLGGLKDFDMLLQVVSKAKEIGSNWREYKNNLDFGVENGFYLYDNKGQRRQLTRPRAKFGKKSFDFFHNTLLEPGRGLHGTVKKVLGSSKGLRQGSGALYKMFFAGFEAPVKKLMFGCEECGDCFLVENFGICSIGKCEKGLDNPPCGDANPDGTCGNNPDIRCVGELIYEAAASEGPGGLEKLAYMINPKRDPALQGTASLLNYLFEKDHMKKVPLIQIGESIHASIPKTGAAMRELLDKGPDAYERPGGVLDYIISLIESQVEHKADYIAVNVDAFGEDDPKMAIEIMCQYVKLVRKYSRGVPVCVDSSDDNILKAGLEQWYSNGDSSLAMPLINSVKVYTINEILPLRRRHPFKVIGLLVDDKSAGADGTYGIDDLYRMARKIYDEATGKYGFKPGDLFFDSTVFPLAIDMPMMPDTPGYT